MRALLRLVASTLVVLPVAAGCASGVYRVANLPKDFIAPSSVNLEEINLSALTDRSVSRDLVQRGDVLDVTLVTDFSRMTTTTTPVRVADDGTVSIPLIGSVPVAGLELEQAEGLIAAESKARGIFRNPSITVTMRQRRMNRVMVVGAVNQPGVYELARGSNSLLAGLLAAGGLSKEAGPEVQIRHTAVSGVAPNGQLAARQGEIDRFVGATVALSPRGGSATATPTTDQPPSDGQLASYQPSPPAAVAPIQVNLVEASKEGRHTPELQDGDVVYVAKRSPKPIYVQGLVRKPGEFPLPVSQELRLLDALALAGGCSNPAADNVLVIRQAPGRQEPVRIALTIEGAKSGPDNLLLAAGDTVMVEQTAATVVVDAVQTFFRFGFSGTIPMF